jgi:hypothetical protein
MQRAARRETAQQKAGRPFGYGRPALFKSIPPENLQQRLAEGCGCREHIRRARPSAVLAFKFSHLLPGGNSHVEDIDPSDLYFFGCQVIATAVAAKYNCHLSVTSTYVTINRLSNDWYCG